MQLNYKIRSEGDTGEIGIFEITKNYNMDTMQTTDAMELLAVNTVVKFGDKMYIRIKAEGQDPRWTLVVVEKPRRIVRGVWNKKTEEKLEEAFNLMTAKN